MLTIEVLTVEESQLLQTQEERIERGFRQFFVEVGEALSAIREARLYRTSHGSFEDYCRDRWNLSKPYASQLIKAAETVNLLRSAGLPLPENERQARELSKLPTPELKIEAWLNAVEAANGNLSNGHVKAVVEQIQNRQQPITPGSKALVIHGNHRGKRVEVKRTDKGVAYATLPDGESYPFLTGELEVVEAAPMPVAIAPAKPKTKDLLAILEKVYTEVGGLMSAELRTEIEAAIGVIVAD